MPNRGTKMSDNVVFLDDDGVTLRARGPVLNYSHLLSLPMDGDIPFQTVTVELDGEFYPITHAKVVYGSDVLDDGHIVLCTPTGFSE